MLTRFAVSLVGEEDKTARDDMGPHKHKLEFFFPTLLRRLLTLQYLVLMSLYQFMVCTGIAFII